MNSIDTKLELEIERELDAMYDMEVGSQEHTAAVRNLKELGVLVIDMRRLDVDEHDKSERRDAEERAREAEERNKFEDRKAEWKHRMINYILNALGIGLPLVVVVWGTKKSFKFEETGTITSQGGREIFKKLYSFLRLK